MREAFAVDERGGCKSGMSDKEKKTSSSKQAEQVTLMSE